MTLRARKVVKGKGNDEMQYIMYTGNFDETYADILEGCTALLKSL